MKVCFHFQIKLNLHFTKKEIVLTDLQETILQLSRKSSSKLAKVAVLLETYTPLIIIKKELSVNSDFEGMNSKLLRICSDSQG